MAVDSRTMSAMVLLDPVCVPRSHDRPQRHVLVIPLKWTKHSEGCFVSVVILRVGAWAVVDEGGSYPPLPLLARSSSLRASCSSNSWVLWEEVILDLVRWPGGPTGAGGPKTL